MNEYYSRNHPDFEKSCSSARGTRRCRGRWQVLAWQQAGHAEGIKNAGLEFDGDTFQPGTFTWVIDGASERVTPIPKLFQKLFCRPFSRCVRRHSRGDFVHVPRLQRPFGANRCTKTRAAPLGRAGNRLGRDGRRTAGQRGHRRQRLGRKLGSHTRSGDRGQLARPGGRRRLALRRSTGIR